jgi:hypothetical protein
MTGVDNTFLGPALQTPLSFGADIVLSVPAMFALLCSFVRCPRALCIVLELCGLPRASRRAWFDIYRLQCVDIYRLHAGTR